MTEKLKGKRTKIQRCAICGGLSNVPICGGTGYGKNDAHEPVFEDFGLKEKKELEGMIRERISVLQKDIDDNTCSPEVKKMLLSGSYELKTVLRYFIPRCFK